MILQRVAKGCDICINTQRSEEQPRRHGGKSTLGREDSRCKGPEARASFLLKTSDGVSVAVAEWVMGRGEEGNQEAREDLVLEGHVGAQLGEPWLLSGMSFHSPRAWQDNPLFQ